MATSRSTTQRLLTYLGSTRNLIGGVAGLVGLGATVPTGLAGPWWPAVVAGMYGIGALLTPKDRDEQIADDLDHTYSQAVDLRKDLEDLARRVLRLDRQLEPEVHAAFGRVVVALRDLLTRAEALVTAPEQLYVVDRMVHHYLPDAIDTYVRLPQAYRTTQQLEGGGTAKDLLLSQLATLEKETGRTAQAVFAGDADKLREQNLMLEQRFVESSFPTELQ